MDLEVSLLRRSPDQYQAPVPPEFLIRGRPSAIFQKYLLQSGSGLNHYLYRIRDINGSFKSLSRFLQREGMGNTFVGADLT